MTVVLPAPVASFSASRISSGFASLFAAARCSRTRLPVLRLRRDLGQPDRGFDRLDLAEERADAAELVMPPVLQEPRRFRRDLPLIGIGQRPPRVDVAADFVDDRSRVVLLLLRRKPLAFVEHESRLRGGFALLRLRDRRDEFGAAPALDDLLRRLPRLIELPMPPWALVGRVQNRMIKKRIGHVKKALAVVLKEPSKWFQAAALLLQVINVHRIQAVRFVLGKSGDRLQYADNVLKLSIGTVIFLVCSTDNHFPKGCHNIKRLHAFGTKISHGTLKRIDAFVYLAHGAFLYGILNLHNGHSQLQNGKFVVVTEKQPLREDRFFGIRSLWCSTIYSPTTIAAAWRNG